jgi:hypothetical protein
VRDAASEMWITSATKIHMLADSQTLALDIEVDTQAAQAWNTWACRRENSSTAARSLTSRQEVIDARTKFSPGGETTLVGVG